MPYDIPGSWATVKRVYVAEAEGAPAGRWAGTPVGWEEGEDGWCGGGRVLKMASAVFGQIFSRILSVGPLSSQARAPRLRPCK